SYSAQLMSKVIGCNVGDFKPDLPAFRNGQLRDELKSVMRGVPDFTAPQYADESSWYPDPTMGTPGASINGNAATFGVYNLNPYVFFVHRTLNLSGYAFSVDDDTADVGAGGATHLFMSVGGLDGLPNPAKYAWGAPYGPVKDIPGNVDSATP